MTSEIGHSIDGASVGYPQSSDETQSSDERGAGSHPPIHIVLVGGNDNFRKALCRDLAEDVTNVVHFATALSAFPYLVAGNSCDVLVADLKTYDRSGLELILQLQRSINPLPVVILAENNGVPCTAYDGSYTRGGTDIVVKSRGLKVIAKTIELAAARAKDAEQTTVEMQDLEIGPLALRSAYKAFWRGSIVPLTMTEFETVWLLARNHGDNVSYRDIYGFFRGKDFVAGRGAEGYRINVRSAIRHIRRKFCETDAEFAEIENFPRYGYRWRSSVSMDLGRHWR
jgi:two-component system response regulator ChvI